LLEVNFSEEHVPLGLDPFGGVMFFLMCMLVMAVFHLDEAIFAPKRLVSHRKIFCGPCRNGVIADPDGRPVMFR
jgi:hypothetical protein